jgi:uncharacterized peroxidase-related enzyme
MTFFKSLPDDAGPGQVFAKYHEIYGHWAEMGQEMMNGPSPFSPGEREMIAAYVVGCAGTRYAYVAHTAVAYAWGIEEGLIDKLLDNLDTAPIEAKWKPIFAYAKKLTLTPNDVTREDADAVYGAGWDEDALHHTIAVSARMNFMIRLIGGFGFTPMSPELAKQRAEERVEKGYVNLYPDLAKK